MLKTFEMLPMELVSSLEQEPVLGAPIVRIRSVLVKRRYSFFETVLVPKQQSEGLVDGERVLVLCHGQEFIH